MGRRQPRRGAGIRGNREHDPRHEHHQGRGGAVRPRHGLEHHHGHVGVRRDRREGDRTDERFDKADTNGDIAHLTGVTAVHVPADLVKLFDAETGYALNVGG